MPTGLTLLMRAFPRVGRRQAVERVEAFLQELAKERDGDRVLLIGHMATWYALESVANGTRLDDLFYARFQWREGWEYSLAKPQPARR